MSPVGSGVCRALGCRRAFSTNHGCVYRALILLKRVRRGFTRPILKLFCKVVVPIVWQRLANQTENSYASTSELDLSRLPSK